MTLKNRTIDLVRSNQKFQHILHNLLFTRNVIACACDYTYTQSQMHINVHMLDNMYYNFIQLLIFHVSRTISLISRGLDKDAKCIFGRMERFTVQTICSNDSGNRRTRLSVNQCKRNG